MLIYTQVLSLLNDKTIIQFQMFGLGNIWRRGVREGRSRGSFQLAVAFKIVSKLRERFPGITMSSQEPCHQAAEIEYLRNQNVYVSERKTFSSCRFVNAIDEANVSQPMMIAYMPYFPIDEFESYLDAHWDPILLSQIIFVGNKGWNYEDPIFAHIKKSKAYFKFSEHRTLPFEQPPIDRNQPQGKHFWEWPLTYGHPSEFWNWKCFSELHVYTISYENAKESFELIPKRLK